MDLNCHIDKEFLVQIRQQEKLGGIDISKLNIGDKIEVQTDNSLYVLEIKDPTTNLVRLTQQKLFIEPVDAVILGSSWGGGTLKLNWVGYGLNLEFTVNATHYITTAIQNAKVVGCNWEYTMEWEKQNGKDEKA